MRIPGAQAMRNRSPGATAQPRSSSAEVVPVSSATGTQIAKPDLPAAGMPRRRQRADQLLTPVGVRHGRPLQQPPTAGSCQSSATVS